MSRTRSKAKKKSLLAQWREWRKDERITKIMAMLCFMMAIYLFISCLSYLFSWKADQDKVMHYSWHILFNSQVVVENWLGRLGALSSHILFYYGLGMAGFLVIPLLVHLGYRFLNRNGWLAFLKFTTHSSIIMVILAMILDFMFHNSEFPWGGSFGGRTNHLMSNFVGEIGLGISLIFALISLFVWFFNPSLQSLQLAPAFENNDASSDFFRFFKGKNERPTEEEKSEMAKSLSIIDKKLQIPDPDPVIVDFTDYRQNTLAVNTQAATGLKAHQATPELEINELVEKPVRNNTEQNVPRASNPAVSEEEDGWEAEGFSLFDPKLELSKYKSPSLDLLNDYNDHKFEIDRSELEANKNLIIATLQNYKIEIQKIKATIGPTVTLYEIVPALGVRISRIKSLEDDIALSLSAHGIRIIAPIPGRGTIGIEVANKNKQIVALKDLFKSEKFNDPKLELPIVLGKNISNEVVVADLTKIPHLLIAGATGQGKSVGINAILLSILYRKHPSEVKVVLIDPKKVELTIYAEIEKHFLARLPNEDEAIITDTSKVIYTLNSLCIEMDQRYELLKAARVRNLLEYNDKFKKRKLNPEKGHKYLPYIVLIIDEFADLIMTAGKEVEMPLGRLAQLARAVGIHLIIATQRPSVKIITGLIKANFPGRIAFKVSSNIDSRTILDYGGAERLIGRGDMLFSMGSDITRLQCPFVDTPEVERVIKHISGQQGFGAAYFLPEYKGDEANNEAGSIQAGDLDEMFEEAARLVVQSQHGSTSMIQRRLKLGYNRAGRIMDQMETLGIVSGAEGSKPREVLIFNEVELDKIVNRFQKT
ncbi:MAG: DNA translocase FtsK [Bacteroidota bacterium]|nr:DNA translocase FtsK [Bacteroidota bacterium]